MSGVLQGELRWHGGDRFAIVVSRYNKTVTDRLLEGAGERLAAAGVPADAVDIVSVPGAWELPVTAARLLWTTSHAGLISLGCVIQGETTHDRYINAQVSRSLSELSWRSGVPIAFGVLTCQTMEQALQRAGGRVGNKGAEAAEAVLELVDLFHRLPGGTGRPRMSLASPFSFMSDSPGRSGSGESFPE